MMQRAGSLLLSELRAFCTRDGLHIEHPLIARKTAALTSLSQSMVWQQYHTTPVPAADGLGGVTSGPVEIFDRDLKRAHRERAAWLRQGEDPLQVEVSERLLDRLEDCKSAFPIAAVLGGANDVVLSRLRGGRAGVQEVLFVDSSRAMLERMQRQQQQQASEDASTRWPRVHYIEADEETLPLREQSLDLIISSLSLHWVNDLPGMMAHCRRALRPDGLFLAALWGGDTLAELRIAHALAEQELEGGVSPRISPLAQVRDAGNLLTRAGFAIPSVDTDDITVNYGRPAELAAHLRRMAESNAVRARRPALRRATAARADEVYAAKFGSAEGGAHVPATFQIIFMTGWSPHERQQRALPRGSATLTLDELQTALDRRKAPDPL